MVLDWLRLLVLGYVCLRRRPTQGKDFTAMPPSHLFVTPSSNRTWSYSLIAATKMTAVT